MDLNFMVDDLETGEVDLFGNHMGPTDIQIRDKVSNAILIDWLSKQPVRPREADIGKQQRRAQAICRKANTSDIRMVIAAWIGIFRMFPYNQGEIIPDMFDLDRLFSKAVAAAANHPQVKARRQKEHLAERLKNGR